jgi:hypothetical protein
MSGVTGDNPYRASGVIAAAAAAGGLSWQDIVTASTLTAEAGNAYWINTTSNACTITLPSSADNGDEIMFADYDRTWGTYGIVLDSNGLNYQGDDDSFDVEYGTDGTALHIVYSDATNGWIPTLDKTVEDVPSKGNENGIFSYGIVSGSESMSNIVSNVGVVAADVTGVGTTRYNLGATEYGGDKGIIGYGMDDAGSPYSMTNLVSNVGVISADVTGVGTARSGIAGAEYGGDKGIFGYGAASGTNVSMTNLVTSVGVVGTDVTGVGTNKTDLGACEYGTDTAIFGFGYPVDPGSSNLVSNTGVVATDVTGVGTQRSTLTACSYGNDKGIFGYGSGTPSHLSLTNLVSNTGVISTDVTGVGTGRQCLASCEYGLDKGIFGYGQNGGNTAITNLVSNTGVVSADVSGVGSARQYLAGCSYN